MTTESTRSESSELSSLPLGIGEDISLLEDEVAVGVVVVPRGLIPLSVIHHPLGLGVGEAPPGMFLVPRKLLPIPEGIALPLGLALTRGAVRLFLEQRVPAGALVPGGNAGFGPGGGGFGPGGGGFGPGGGGFGPGGGGFGPGGGGFGPGGGGFGPGGGPGGSCGPGGGFGPGGPGGGFGPGGGLGGGDFGSDLAQGYGFPWWGYGYPGLGYGYGYPWGGQALDAQGSLNDSFARRYPGYWFWYGHR